MLKYVKDVGQYRKMAPKVNVEKYIANGIKWNAKNSYTSIEVYLNTDGESKGAYSFVKEHVSDFESKGFELEWYHDNYDTERKLDKVILRW